MASDLMAVHPALAAQINVHQMTDTEIRKVMRDAAAEADRIVRSLEGKEGVAAKVRSAQTQLAKLQAEAWASVGHATTIGIGDAFDATAELRALTDSKLFNSTGISSVAWRNSVLATSREGINSFISRQEFNYTLSQRVYRNRTLSTGQVNKAINNGLLLGKSATEIAKDVKRFIDPRTPGGASYAAMRLGRTELQNAFHTSAVKSAQQTPWVDVVKWWLSGSHPRPDKCNEYAESQHFRGGQAGEFKADDVPPKPHPQCLCYIEDVTIDADAFVKNFKAGKYDNWIDQTMGCQVAG